MRFILSHRLLRRSQQDDMRKMPRILLGVQRTIGYQLFELQGHSSVHEGHTRVPQIVSHRQRLLPKLASFFFSSYFFGSKIDPTKNLDLNDLLIY